MNDRSVEDRSDEEMSVEEMSVEEMSVEEMSVEEMSVEDRMITTRLRKLRRDPLRQLTALTDLVFETVAASPDPELLLEAIEESCRRRLLEAIADTESQEEGYGSVRARTVPPGSPTPP
ncbi:hypothetical protein [Streptomyces sp. 8L]|uniref:hypothetical protein n=1 Tax=Streptomyces sp. 8L TaxID=2877242 RepID=UPI001CD22C32|nr:hypothetical protein [Streptomyces sp. 8L]MCA1218286.1 hypothetical protein [Streptomyces sp. 8L]